MNTQVTAAGLIISTRIRALELLIQSTAARCAVNAGCVHDGIVTLESRNNIYPPSCRDDLSRLEQQIIEFIGEAHHVITHYHDSMEEYVEKNHCVVSIQHVSEGLVNLEEQLRESFSGIRVSMILRSQEAAESILTEIQFRAVLERAGDIWTRQLAEIIDNVRDLENQVVRGFDRLWDEGDGEAERRPDYDLHAAIENWVDGLQDPHSHEEGDV